MANDNENDAAPDRGGDKKSARSRANDAVKTGADAAVELIGGLADALGSAVRRAGDEIDKDNATRVDFKNGLLRGMVEGTAHFLDKLPDVVRNTYDIVNSSVSEEETSRDGKSK